LVIGDAENNGVSRIITIGVDLASCRKNLSYADQFPNVYTAIGFHPHESKKMTREGLLILEEMLSYPKTIAIGEIGLDYYYQHSSRDEQTKAFYQQIELAKKYNLPVIIHSREAHEDTRRILAEKAIGMKVILHCFSGELEMAKWCIEQGFYFGIGGVITFKNAQKLAMVVQEIPLSSILLETDSPFLTPHPFRGKPNEPKYLPIIAEKIAELKGKTLAEIVQITTENSLQVFHF
jgi:TatD DNase family protein